MPPGSAHIWNSSLLPAKMGLELKDIFQMIVKYYTMLIMCVHMTSNFSSPSDFGYIYHKAYAFVSFSFELAQFVK